MGKVKTFLLSVLLMTLAFGVSSCSKDDEPADAGTSIEGRYSGKLTSGGTVVETKCYATLTRYSANAVKVQLESDNHNPSPIIVDITGGNGSYELTSENYSVNGTIRGGVFTFSYSTAANYSYTFVGTK